MVNWAIKKTSVSKLRIEVTVLTTQWMCPDEQVTVMGVMQALVSFVQAGNDMIRSIHAGDTNFVFIVKGPLTLVAVSKTKESVSLLVLQLTFVYNQILSILTQSQLTRVSESFKAAESWTPICLPRFDSNGFMHAHVSYVAEDCQACLLLLIVDRDVFFTLSEAKQKIVEKLRRTNCLEAINESMNKTSITTAEIGLPEMRHVLYKLNEHATHSKPDNLQQLYTIFVKFVCEAFQQIKPGLTLDLLALFGTLHQETRLKIYTDFDRKQHAVVFVTDTASRALDFSNVTWIVQMDSEHG
ncbi:hypothetical protein TKK_0000219 [Trichogramma kaykai]